MYCHKIHEEKNSNKIFEKNVKIFFQNWLFFVKEREGNLDSEKLGENGINLKKMFFLILFLILHFQFNFL